MGDEGAAIVRSFLSLLLVWVVFASSDAFAQTVLPAISSDPPADKAHPAAMTVLHILADMGLIGSAPHAQAVSAMADDMETLAGVTAQTMADEVIAHAKEFVVAGTAMGLARIPVLAITSEDHLASHTDSLMAAIISKGGKVTTIHMDTDHGYSDHRIALENAVITWLSGLN